MSEFRELSRKYRNTISLIYDKEAKIQRVAAFQNISSDGEDEVWTALMEASSRETYTSEQRKNLNFPVSVMQPNLNAIEFLKIPTRRVFDWGNRTIVFCRSPNRQWHKGLTNNNTQFFDKIIDMLYNMPVPKDVAIKNLNSFKLNIKNLIPMFFPDYSGTLVKALHDIAKDNLLSRAINDMYYISQYPSLEYPYLLFRYEFPIAFYNPKNSQFSLVEELYKQEVLDFCNRQGVKYEIRN